jgi:hypothetical protein
LSDQLGIGCCIDRLSWQDFSGLGLQSCLLCYDFATGMLGRVEANMQDEEWIKTLEDGRIVKFIYQELLEDGAFISAQLAGNEVV